MSNQTGLKLCRTVDSSHNTPLHVAAAKGNIGAIKLLLVTKVKVDARNELNKTPMHLASQNGHVAYVCKHILHSHILTPSHPHTLILTPSLISSHPHTSHPHPHTSHPHTLTHISSPSHPHTLTFLHPLSHPLQNMHMPYSQQTLTISAPN